MLTKILAEDIFRHLALNNPIKVEDGLSFGVQF
jgi:hypothetical protein